MADENLEEMLERVWREFYAAHGFKNHFELDKFLRSASASELRRLSDDFHARERRAWEERYPDLGKRT